jgi:hypothetical protein
MDGKKATEEKNCNDKAGFLKMRTGVPDSIVILRARGKKFYLHEPREKKCLCIILICDGSLRMVKG